MPAEEEHDGHLVLNVWGHRYESTALSGRHIAEAVEESERSQWLKATAIEYHQNLSLSAPSLHPHCTRTAPALHLAAPSPHCCTLTARSPHCTLTALSPYCHPHCSLYPLLTALHPHRTHCTLTAPFLHPHCTPAPSLHPCTLTAPSLHPRCTLTTRRTLPQ
jgi:hypothetical protein